MNYEQMIALREAKESAEHAFKKRIAEIIRENGIHGKSGELRLSISLKEAMDYDVFIEDFANTKKATAKEFNKVKKQLEAIEADREERAKLERETELTEMRNMVREIHAHVLSGNPVTKPELAIVPETVESGSSSPTHIIDSYLDSLEKVNSDNVTEVQQEPEKVEEINEQLTESVSKNTKAAKREEREQRKNKSLEKLHNKKSCNIEEQFNNKQEDKNLIEQINKDFINLIKKTNLLSEDDENIIDSQEYRDTCKAFKGITTPNDLSMFSLNKYYQDNDNGVWCEEIENVSNHNTKQLLKAIVLIGYRTFYTVKHKHTRSNIWSLACKYITKTLCKEFTFDYIEEITEYYENNCGFISNKIDNDEYNEVIS